MLKYGYHEVTQSVINTEERTEIPSEWTSRIQIIQYTQQPRWWSLSYIFLHLSSVTLETGHNATKGTEQSVSLKRHASGSRRDFGKVTGVEKAGPKTIRVKSKRRKQVFKVSLSLMDGPLVLERTSFSRDNSPTTLSPDTFVGPITFLPAQTKNFNSDMDSDPTLLSSGQPGPSYLHPAPRSHPHLSPTHQDTTKYRQPTPKL